MKLALALHEAYDATTELGDDLAAAAATHAADHDVFHIGRRLAGRCAGVASLIAPYLEQLGERPDDPTADDGGDGIASRIRRGLAVGVGRTSAGGQMLLRDLRELEVAAHGCTTDWVIARQGALAARDEALADACAVAIEELGRVEKWLTTRIKEAAPQVLMG